MWSHLTAAVSLIYIGKAYDQNEAINALWYAYGAYCDASELQDWDCKWCNYVDFEILSGGVITGNSLQSFIGYDTDYKRIVLSFRGTANFDDWIKDFTFDQTEYPYGSASESYVHEGFYDSWKELLNDGLYNNIKTIFTKYGSSSPILVTGHSLGAAIAQIAALELKSNPTYTALRTGSVKTITFGSPRWCTASLAAYYDSIIDLNWRIVNEDDIVPTVPYTYMGDHDYHHTATEIHYTKDSPLEYTICDGSGEDDDCSYIGFSVDDHLNYMGVKEDCSSSSSMFIDVDNLSDLMTSTSDNAMCPCDDTMTSTTESGDDDDDGRIIYKFKEGLDNVSKVALSIAVAVGWFLAFIFCCCWCKTHRDLVKGRRGSYVQMHEV